MGWRRDYMAIEARRSRAVAPSCQSEVKEMPNASATCASACLGNQQDHHEYSDLARYRLSRSKRVQFECRWPPYSEQRFCLVLRTWLIVLPKAASHKYAEQYSSAVIGNSSDCLAAGTRKPEFRFAYQPGSRPDTRSGRRRERHLRTPRGGLHHRGRRRSANRIP